LEKEELNMNEQTKISRAGSTGRVAEVVGEVVCNGGAAIDVRLAKDVIDVGPYQVVIVDSAIYMGQWK
jgi:menaquinone-dependent protoporphyrinogen IX oxidase